MLTKQQSILRYISKNRWPIIVGLVIGLMLLSTAAVIASTPESINVSGVETFPGLPCGHDKKCGVAFRGWIGGGGAMPIEQGWVEFPGANQGAVTVRIRYEGTVDFGQTVEVQGGYWWIALKDGPTLFGPVDSGGSVQWPDDGYQSVDDGDGIDCGPGVAEIHASLSNGQGAFNGCLYDLKPDGSIIFPPKVWGTFSKS